MNRKMYFAVAFDRNQNMVFVPTISTNAEYKQVLPVELDNIGYAREDGSIHVFPWSVDDNISYWGFINNGDFSSECVKVKKSDDGNFYEIDTEDQQNRNEFRTEFGGLSSI